MERGTLSGRQGDDLSAGETAERELLQRIDALSAIFDLTRWFAGSRALQDILNDTAERITKVMNVKACGIRLLDEETGELHSRAAYNLSQAYLNKGPILLAENPVDAVAMQGETVYIAEAATDPRVRYPEEAKAEGLVSGLCVPMTYRGKTVGVIRVYTDRPYQFSRYEEALLRNAGSQVAAGILEARRMREQREREQHARQLRYAGEIQRRMIPQRLPDHSWIEFGCVYDPSLEVGGDFYDFIELPKGALGLTIADVVGKGVPSALMMASVRSALRAHTASVVDPKRIVARVNRHLCRDTAVSEFATVFYGVFDGKLPRLRYTNAGHDPPLLLRGDVFRELDTGGMVIGVRPETMFEEETIDMAPGDLLVCYTDGVVDASSFSGERFGRGRLEQSILRYRDLSAGMIAQQLLWDTRRFAGLAPQTDDITIVTAKVR